MFKTRKEYIDFCKAENAKISSKLVQYVRHKNGQPRGVVVSFRDPESGVIRVGWSLCNKRDKFDKQIGVHQAIERAEPASFIYYSRVPHTVANALTSMVDRAKRFFKHTKEALVKA